MNSMKVLIIKTSSLGDIIHTFPVVGLIKELFPHSTIDWVVEQPSLELVKAHPNVDRAIEINTKQWRKKWLSGETIQAIKTFKGQLQETEYDVIFDLQGNVKSGIATWLAKSPHKVGFSKERVPEWPNLLATNRRYLPPPEMNIRNEYLYLVQSHFQNFCAYDYPGIKLNLTREENAELSKIVQKIQTTSKIPIMICGGSNWKNKQLSEECLESFLELTQKHYDCQFIFVWGKENEKEIAECLSKKFKSSIVLNKMSLPLLQHVMYYVKLVIAMDSLALHLAATTSTPTFSVFGASLASKYKPTGKIHVAIQGKCPYGQNFNARCPKLRSCSTGACIRSLTGQAIFDAMPRFLSM